jgi:hypothetical protein
MNIIDPAVYPLLIYNKTDPVAVNKIITDSKQDILSN